MQEEDKKIAKQLERLSKDIKKLLAKYTIEVGAEYALLTAMLITMELVFEDSDSELDAYHLMNKVMNLAKKKSSTQEII